MINLKQRACYMDQPPGVRGFVTSPAVITVGKLEFCSRQPWSKLDAENINRETAEYVDAANLQEAQFSELYNDRDKT